MSERIVICGVPKAGKTTLAASMGGLVFHTDDHIGLDREGQIRVSAAALDDTRFRIFEGVYMAHALREFLRIFPDGKPCERVVWMPEPRVPYALKGQHAMAKGVATVWSQVESELRRRGVAVELGGLAAETAARARR